MALSSKPKQRARAAAQEDDELSRFAADIPKRIHKLVRMKCVELDVDLKTFLLQMLASVHGIK